MGFNHYFYDDLMVIYPLVIWRSYWKRLIEILDSPIKDGDFP